jgi:hypothetical protein
MHDRDDQELSASERQAFEALPREQMPGRLLEERIVADLRARGYLGVHHARHGGWNRYAIGAAVAACAVALFASGLAVGQWIGARHTASAMLAVQAQDAASSAAAVQRTGSAYVTALGALAAASSSGDSLDLARARETARTVLHQAANEMVRLAPDDPVSAQILQGLERARIQSAATQPGGSQRVVWF